MVGTDRMQAARIATGGKDAHVVPRVYGRVGYDVPVAQSATFRLKPYDTASDDDDASVVDEANAYAEGSVFRSQAGAIQVHLQVAALMTQAAAISMIWVPWITLPLPLRLPRRLPCRLSPLL